MSAKAFIQDLKSKGVSIWVEGNVLRYRGPREVLTPDVLQTLRAKKQEIINEKKPTKARGYGCGACGNKIYQAVQAWETNKLPEPSPWTHNHWPIIAWQCEQCGAVYEIINGSLEPQPLY